MNKGNKGSVAACVLGVAALGAVAAFALKCTDSLEEFGNVETNTSLYNDALNNSTPTQQELDMASGGSSGTPPYEGGVSVDFGSERGDNVLPCSQNAPTFVASSLLPKPQGQEDTWGQADAQAALAYQDFLSATQRIGTDTVLSSLRNSSHDLRNNIPNPMGVVSPWLNSTITPDLTRKPLDCYTTAGGVYGCDEACNQ